MNTTLISAADLAHQIATQPPSLAVVDCRFSLADTGRGRRAYLDSHIPGAVYADLDADLSGPVIPGVSGRHPLPDPDTLARTLGGWGIGPRVQVVVYDDAGGSIAARLWWLLRWLGHEATALLDGGWQAWLDAGGATAQGLETRAPAQFIPRVQPGWVLDTPTVAAIRQHPAWRLLDARSADRFRGENETIDPVAGHIPGARSAPWAENLAADGRFLPPEQLAARYQALLDATPPAQTAVYCGSGVTACHTLLALTHAGLPGAKLYAGSWSEWITNKELDVGC
ncbi:MAG: sulfurtransferase [Caldilineales bacterium]|nr:sulfurtransferase [Caldilineales bacterium]